MTYRSRKPPYYLKYNQFYRMGYRTTVPSVGIMRRLQALNAIGYSMREVHELTGVSLHQLQDVLRGRRPKRVALSTAKPVIEVYRSLCTQPKFDPVANNLRTKAKKKGFAPPYAWDDIDNPNDEPRL